MCRNSVVGKVELSGTVADFVYLVLCDAAPTMKVTPAGAATKDFVAMTDEMQEFDRGNLVLAVFLTKMKRMHLYCHRTEGQH